MNTKPAVLCVFSVLILVTAVYAPHITAHTTINKQQIEITNQDNSIAVTITNYLNGITIPTQKTITQQEANALHHILRQYHHALTTDNTDHQEDCEAWLHEKQLLTPEQLRIISHHTTTKNPVTSYRFSAVGNGIMLFPAEVSVLEWIIEQVQEQDNFIAQFVLFILLVVLFYTPVMLVTHLIPFRIAMPHGQVRLDSGTMTINGENVPPPATVNLTGFTGITISTPPTSSDEEENNDDGGFLFVKGIARNIVQIEP